MGFEYLVQYKEISCIIEAETQTRAAVVNALNESEELSLSEDEVKFKYWVERYSTYVDLRPAADFPPVNTRLLISDVPRSVVNVPPIGDDQPPLADKNVSNDSLNGDNGDNAASGASSPSNSQDADRNVGANGALPTSSMTPTSFPLVYRLPKLPSKVYTALTKGKTEKEKLCSQKKVRDCRKLRNNLMQTIKEDLERFSDYPSSAFQVACNTLVAKFPGLKDEQSSDRDSNLNYSPIKTLLGCLKNKFKYVRRFDEEPSETMIKMRQKYGKKRKLETETADGSEAANDAEAENGQETSDGGLLKRVNKNREHLKLPPNAGVGETEATVAVHKQTICKQWNSANPDLGIISSRMDRTILDRLKCYDLSPSRVLEEYPNMSDCFQILKDVQRYFDWDFPKSRKEYLTEMRVNGLYDQLLKKPMVAKDKAFDSKACTFDAKLVQVLKFLPSLFKEKAQVLVKTLSKNKPVAATEHHAQIVIVQGDAEEEGDTYYVFLDKQLLCANCLDIASALDVLMAAIYLFDTVFPLGRTCRFLAEMLYHVPFMTLRVQTIQSVINKLATYACSEEAATESD